MARQDARSMRSARRLPPGLGAFALAPLFALYPSPGSAPSAAAARGQIAVGATVLARAVIASESSPAELDVSPADVARGYVEVVRATRLVIANTSPYGYALDVWPAAPVFTAVVVAGAGPAARLPDDGGAIVARGAHGASLPLVLDFRFELAPGLAPGRYPWPLRLKVRPLVAP